MSKIIELKNHCHSVSNKVSSEQSKAQNSVVAWNDKVGVRATDSLKETINLWSSASKISFQSVDATLTALISIDAELESIKTQLSNIITYTEQEIQKTNSVKEHK